MENTAVSPLFTRRQLVRLIIPLVVEQFLAMTIGMADTMMVTSCGDAVVSGISLVDSINLLLIQVFAALATGGAVLASQYLGRQEPHKGRQAAKQLIYTSAVAALAIMVLCLLFRRQILLLIFGAVEADVMAAAMTYFRLTAISFPFLAVYNAGAALFRSMGNSKVSMFTSLLMNILNIGGNAVLIFGFQWGAAGAGTATLVSRSIGAIVMLILICQKKHVLHIEQIWKPEFHKDMLGGILKVGIPNGVENGMFQIGKLTVARLITSFGTAALAANAISNSVSSVVVVPGNAMGLAMITVVGQCMGARQPEQAVSYTKKIMGLIYLFNGMFSLATIFGVKPLMASGLFQLSPEAAALAGQVCQAYGMASLVFWPMSFSLPCALRAAGDAKFTMMVSLLSMWIFRIGCSYLITSLFDLTLLGTWLAMFIDWVVRGTCFLIRFAKGRWKTIQLIH